MRTTLGALACLALLTGCSSGVVDGTPIASPLTDPTFIPCDDIPDDAIRALGYDPATAARDILDVTQPGWSMCRWTGPERFLVVYATGYSLAEARAKPTNTNFVPVVIDGRDGFTFHETSDPDHRACNVLLTSGPGIVMVEIGYAGVAPVTHDPCALAIDATRGLAPHIPN